MLSTEWLLADAATLVVVSLVVWVVVWDIRTVCRKVDRRVHVLGWHELRREREAAEDSAVRRRVRTELFPRVLVASADIAVRTRPLPDALVAAVEMTSLRAVS